MAFPVSDRAQKDSNCQPPKQNSGKLIPTKKRNPCPICGDTSGRCRTKRGDAIVLCARQGDSLRKSDSITGADGGGWTLHKRGDLWNTFAPERAKTTRFRAPASTPVVTAPAPSRASIEARHQAFTLLLERQSLHTDDAADLTRRGFTHEQIQQMGAKTLRQGLRFPEAPLGLPGFCSVCRVSAQDGSPTPLAIWW